MASFSYKLQVLSKMKYYVYFYNYMYFFRCINESSKTLNQLIKQLKYLKLKFQFVLNLKFLNLSGLFLIIYSRDLSLPSSLDYSFVKVHHMA